MLHCWRQCIHSFSTLRKMIHVAHFIIIKIQWDLINPFAHDKRSQKVCRLSKTNAFTAWEANVEQIAQLNWIKHWFEWLFLHNTSANEWTLLSCNTTNSLGIFILLDRLIAWQKLIQFRKMLIGTNITSTQPKWFDRVRVVKLIES